MRLLLFFLATMLVPSHAAGAPVTIVVNGSNGKPLAGAVVQVKVPHAPPAASRLIGPFLVAQKDISFQPHLLIVPVGAAVAFPNRDKVRHHVYSFSPAKRFELKLYGQRETRSIVFDRAGVIALGCNIHDAMSGFIIVVDTPFAAQTDAAGRVSFSDVSTGNGTISVWHPSIRAPGGTAVNPATITVTGLSTTLTLTRR